MQIQPKGFYYKFQQIRVLQKIGRGAQADVYLVEDQNTAKKFAMKVLRNKNLSLKQTQRISSQIQYNYILNKDTDSSQSFPYFQGYWQSQFGVHLLFQKCDSNVQSYFLTIKQSQQRFNFSFVLLHDIIHSLAILQKHQIIHRDIKLQNILIKNNRFKLADMGLARFSSRQNRLTTQIGNIMSKAPQFYSGIYNHKADVWSLGINIFYLLENSLPFDKITKKILSQNIQQFFQIMEKQQLTIVLNQKSRQQQFKKNILYQILQKMLIVNSIHRYSALQVLTQFFDDNLLKKELVCANFQSLVENELVFSKQQTKKSQKLVFNYLLLFYLNNSNSQQGLLGLTALIGLYQFIKTCKINKSKSQKLIEQRKNSSKNFICTKIQNSILKILQRLSQYFQPYNQQNSLIPFALKKIVETISIYSTESSTLKQIESMNDLEIQITKMKIKKKSVNMPKSLKVIKQNINLQQDLNLDKMLKIYQIKKVQQKFPLLKHLIEQAKILLNPNRQPNEISKICLWKIPIDVRKIYFI